MIRLTAGGWSATIRPELGGAILGLDWRGHPVLRPTPDGSNDILETACFPLVPYANRIAGGRFAFGGHRVALPVPERFAPHALHGDGWLRPWTVEAVDEASVRMTLAGGGDHWPWCWTAVQTLSLGEAGLRIDLVMTNDSDEPAPAGLGLHPYFARATDARLTLVSEAVWLTDAGQIPDRTAPPTAVVDWSAGRALAGAPFVDHAYAGWPGRAKIDGDGRRVTLTASDTCRWVQVYAPPGADFLCVEPVTHRPDALNAPAGEGAGVTVLASGESLSMWLTIGVET